MDDRFDYLLAEVQVELLSLALVVGFTEQTHASGADAPDVVPRHLTLLSGGGHAGGRSQ